MADLCLPDSVPLASDVVCDGTTGEGSSVNFHYPGDGEPVDFRLSVKKTHRTRGARGCKPPGGAPVGLESGNTGLTSICKLAGAQALDRNMPCHRQAIRALKERLSSFLARARSFELYKAAKARFG